MNVIGTIIQFFQSGGAFMYPIILVLILGLAISIERWLFLASSHKANRNLWASLLPQLNAGDLAGASQRANDSDTAIGRVLGHGLSRSQGGGNRQDVEMAMEESLMEVMPLLEKRTHYLATFANIATLIGLLGTIIGLIKAFTAVANVNPAEKADLLSASISVAMNTTAFGLIAAIPLLLLHAWLTTKTSELVDSLEMAAVKLMNTLGNRA